MFGSNRKSKSSSSAFRLIDGDEDAKKISKQEYVALVAAVAQTIAGPGKTPTAFQLQLARNNVNERLKSRNATVEGAADAARWCNTIQGQLERAAFSSSGSSEVGGFWDQVKSAAAATLDVAKKYGRYALPLLPVATAAPVALIAYQQYQKAQADKAARARAAADQRLAAEATLAAVASVAAKNAAEENASAPAAPAAPAEAPPAPAPAPAAEAPAASAPVTASGLDAIIGAAYVDHARSVLVPPQLTHSGRARRAARQNRAILSSDERTAVTEAGGAEAEATTRRKRPYYFPKFVSVGTEVPHEVYRAAIWKKAGQISGSRSPSAVALCKAQHHVDRAMAAKGAVVTIPGAKPGRVTR